MSQPLLTYACTTDPFPLQASPAQGAPAVATVQVVATNQSGVPVSLEGMSIGLPVGSSADALTLDPAAIGVVPPAGWTQGASQSPAGAVVFVFLPGSGAGTVPAGGSLAFTLGGVEVNQQAGTATVTVMEGSGGCSPPGCPTVALAVTKFPAGWGNVEFSALPPNVSPGGNASVQWSGPAGATYTLQYYTPATGVVTVPAAGAPPLGSSGVYPGVSGPALALQTTTVFTLQVAYSTGGNVYAAQRQATVVVVPLAPIITRFDGVLSGPADARVLTLTWETENAKLCELTGVSETLVASGTRPFPNPLEPGAILPSYTLTVWAALGLSTTATFQVPPTITRFTATPVTDGPSMRLELSWAATLAEQCTITGVPGVLAASGTATVTPSVAAPLAGECTLTALGRGKTDTSTISLQWNAKAVAAPIAQTYPVQSTGTPRAAVTPDGARLLVSTPWGMQLFSGTTLFPLSPSSVPAVGAAGPIAVNPAGTRVYAAIGGTVAAYDAATFQPVGSAVQVPGDLHGAAVLGLAVSAGGDRLFLCAGSSQLVAVLDAATLKTLGWFNIPGNAAGVAATPDGRSLVFAGGSSVYVVDAQSYAPSAEPIPVPVASGGVNRSVAITPDSAFALVSGTAQQTPALSSVDLRTGAVVALHPTTPPTIINQAFALAASPDGSRLYAAWSGSSSTIPGATFFTVQPVVFLRSVVSGGIGG